MSNRNNHFREKKLTVWQQIYFMRNSFNQLQEAVSGNRAVWRGPMNHSRFGVSYEVLIEYVWPKRPKIWVTQPILVTRPGKKIPHRYEDRSLCLHLPHEWDPGKIIATTIVPWISHWLFYYEIWLATDQWLGGGEHPKGGKA